MAIRPQLLCWDCLTSVSLHAPYCTAGPPTPRRQVLTGRPLHTQDLPGHCARFSLSFARNTTVAYSPEDIACFQPESFSFINVLFWNNFRFTAELQRQNAEFPHRACRTGMNRTLRVGASLNLHEKPHLPMPASGSIPFALHPGSPDVKVRRDHSSDITADQPSDFAWLCAVSPLRPVWVQNPARGSMLHVSCASSWIPLFHDGFSDFHCFNDLDGFEAHGRLLAPGERVPVY